MNDYEIIVVLSDLFEAQLMNESLKEAGIPFELRSYHDSAYDGIFQSQKGYGHIAASPEFRDEIIKIHQDILATVPKDIPFTQNSEKSAQYWVDSLNLQKHPEGGYFAETYRSSELMHEQSLPERFFGDRCFSTCIYFLLTSDEFSAFHRIKSDEIWHFYDGAPITLHIIWPNGEYSTQKLGRRFEHGEQFQVIVPAGCYFAAEVSDENCYCLAGCTVAPGFDFDDFEIPTRSKLSEQFPEHTDIIRQFSFMEPAK